MRIKGFARVALVASVWSASAVQASPPEGSAANAGGQPALASAAALPPKLPSAPAQSAQTPAPAVAAPNGEKPKPQAQPSREVRAATQRVAEEKLAGHDPAAIGQALDSLVQLGGEPSVAAIVARLRRGLTPQLTERAIECLVVIGKPSAGPALLELTLHRRAKLRQAAMTALGALKIRSAQSALLLALDDPSPDVRAAAARALAEVGTPRALPTLWEAAERGVGHALETIGTIATTREIKPVFAHVQNNDVTLIAPALQAMLERDSFPLAGKLTIVQEVEKLGSPSARMYLVRWLDAWKESGHPRLRQTLFDAIKRLDDAQKLLAAQNAKQPAEAPATAKTQATVAASAAKGAHP
jgi:HEAT repeat protein